MRRSPVSTLGRLALCVFLSLCWQQARAQQGCSVPVTTTSAPPKIQFMGDDRRIDWGAIRAGYGAWTKCSAAPTFSVGGDRLATGFSRVSVSVVGDNQMDFPGACAEASVGTIRINLDAPSTCSRKTWLVYAHEVGHVLGLDHARGDACGPQGDKPGNIMWEYAGRISDNVAVTDEACDAVRRARGMDPPPPPGGGGGPRDGGSNPGGGADPGQTGTDRCVDHPFTPGCPVNCDLNPQDSRCGKSDVCEYYPGPGGSTPSADNHSDCPPAPY